MNGTDDRDTLPAWALYYDKVTHGLFVVSMVLLLTGMSLLIGMDVILRVFFGSPIRGVHDLVGLGLLSLFLLGLPHSWRGEHHVRMDMVYMAMGPRMKTVINVLGGLAAAIFALLLAYQAYRYIPHVMRVGSSSVTLRIPYWPFTIMVMVTSIMFALSIIQDMILSAFYRKRV
jgi:TRAP-type C4-dicarboxylate transport system permease small subunit